MKRLFIFMILLSGIFASCNTAKFSLNERKLIRKKYTEKIMPLMLVSNNADSVILYTKSIKFPVNSEDKKLRKLTDLMYHTCIDSTNPGVGIAAPQVGVNKRIIWVQRFDKKEKPFEVYFNIEIKEYSTSKSDGWEGCLSVPGYRGIVRRSDTIVINYDTFDKKNITETVSGFTAVIFQHETDHLNGILYTDRIFDKSNLYSDEEYKRIFKTKNSSN